VKLLTHLLAIYGVGVHRREETLPSPLADEAALLARETQVISLIAGVTSAKAYGMDKKRLNDQGFQLKQRGSAG